MARASKFRPPHSKSPDRSGSSCTTSRTVRRELTPLEVRSSSTMAATTFTATHSAYVLRHLSSQSPFHRLFVLPFLREHRLMHPLPLPSDAKNTTLTVCSRASRITSLSTSSTAPATATSPSMLTSLTCVRPALILVSPRLHPAHSPRARGDQAAGAPSSDSAFYAAAPLRPPRLLHQR